MRSHGEMRDDDAFWAARRVMAFSDDLLHAAVDAGGFSRPADAEALFTVLRQRRDAIGHTYLPRLNPVVDPVLSDSALVVHNAAVESGVATAPSRYHARWFAFDNGRGAVDAARRNVERQRAAGATVRARVRRWRLCAGRCVGRARHAVEWARPVELYFRRDAAAWTLVGLAGRRTAREIGAGFR